MTDKQDHHDDDMEAGEESLFSFPLIDGVAEALRHMSPGDLLALGMADVAYVRPTQANDESVYQICAADGTVLATLDDYQHALSTIGYNDLRAVPLH